MTTLNLASVEAEVLQLLGIVVLAVLSAAGTLLARKLHLAISADQRAALDEIAGKSLDAGIARSMDLIKRQGWDHADVKNQVVADAAEYAIAQFPQAIKRAGINTSDPVAAAVRLATGVMARKFPDAVTKAAASPATPPTTTPPATGAST